MNNFIKDIKLILINKKILGIIVFIMVMVCAVLCTHHNLEKKDNETKFIIGIIDEENNRYTDILIDFFKINETFSKLAYVYEGEKEHIQKEFYAGNINAYIVIPKGFVNSLMYLEPINISVYLDSNNETEAIMLKSLLSSYEKYVLAVQFNSSGLYDICKESGMDKKLNHKQNVSVSWNLIKKTLNKESYFKYNEIKVNNIGLIEHYICLLIFLVIVYMGIYTGIIVKREQLSGVYDLYKVMGGNIYRYVFSKAFCVSIIVTVCVTLPLLVGEYIGVASVKETVIFLVFVMSFIINVLLIIGSLGVKNVKTYMLVFNLLFLVLVIIGGGIIQTVYMPDKLNIIAKYLPYSVFENIINGYINI